MNNKGNALTSFIVLALGIALIWLHRRPNLLHTIVMICGVSFIVPAAVSLVGLFVAKSSQRASALYRAVQMICGVGGLGLGICILVMPDTFKGLLVYLFAALMIVGGAMQVYQISHSRRPVDYPAWMYVVPIAVLVCGVVMLLVPGVHGEQNEWLAVLITGIAFVVFGCNGLMVTILAHRLPLRPLESAPHTNDDSAGQIPDDTASTHGLDAETPTDVESH